MPIKAILATLNPEALYLLFKVCFLGIFRLLLTLSLKNLFHAWKHNTNERDLNSFRFPRKEPLLFLQIECDISILSTPL